MNYFIPSSISISKRIYSFFHQNKFNKTLVIFSQSAKKNGSLDRALKYLKSKNINYHEYKKEESIKYQLDKIINLKCDFDSIVSIGGGSVIDFSKILKYFLYKKKIDNDFLNQEQYSFQYLGKNKIQLIVIVTLFGSGSESSNVSVINSDNKKFFYISNDFIPNHVIYDHRAQSQIPFKVASKHIIDSFTHAVEALGSPIQTPISNFFAVFTINNVYKLLKSTSANKEIEKKELEYLAISSFFGGLSQSNVGTGLAHALAHASEQLFQISHSNGVAHFSYFSYIHNININSKIYDDKIGDSELIKRIDQCYKLIVSSFNYRDNDLSIILNSKRNISSLLKIAAKDSCWRLNIAPPNEDLIIKMINEEN